MFVIKRTELAFDIVKGTPHSVGYDLISPYNYTIKPGGSDLVETDLTVIFPEGYYGTIADRSSMAWKNCISVMGGVIYPDYRGTIKVILHNHSKEDYHIVKGNKIAQLIFKNGYFEIPVHQIVFNRELPSELNIVLNQPDGGFGSTGK